MLSDVQVAEDTMPTLVRGRLGYTKRKIQFGHRDGVLLREDTRKVWSWTLQATHGAAASGYRRRGFGLASGGTHTMNELY